VKPSHRVVGAAKEGVAPKAVWRNVAKLAKSLAVHRQGLWAS
jgi:hypothetical protein